MSTQVVEMTSGTTLWAWLCERCQEARRAVGWTVKPKQIIAWGCDDCGRAAQLALGYGTQTVDFVPTAPESFCPAPGWRPDLPVAPWPRADAKKKNWQRVESEILKPIEEGGR